MTYEDSTEAGALPTIRLRAPDIQINLIRRLQAFVLKHPTAAKAAFAALVAEGEAYAQTPEGVVWRKKLAGSELLHRARLMLDLPGLSLLERQTDTAYPSAYLDAVFMLSSADKAGALIEPLFDWEFDGHGD